MAKEHASPSLIKATLVISPSGGPREEGLGFRAGCNTLYQNAIKLIPIMLIITHRIAGTLGRCDSVWNAGVAATLTPWRQGDRCNSPSLDARSLPRCGASRSPFSREVNTLP